MTDEEHKKQVTEHGLNPCCREPENIEVIRTTNPHIVIRKCRECGCNHYWGEGEPAGMGVKSAT